jgi:uncharacterized Zn finger protein
MTPPRKREPDQWRPWEDPDFTAQGPLPVEGGLTARSTRGQIGEQWWSKRFLAVMESFALGTRLTRGRAYARKGQVISLEVDPGEVRASVQGSRVTPYSVQIGLVQFSQLIWAKAEVVLAEQAIHSARLLAGEFPPELEPVFEGIGAPLFPSRLGDLTMSCSCPDHAVPCKHLAAAFYLLAERFDDDPFLILRWRGRGREALLARLRELRGDDPARSQEPQPGLDDALAGNGNGLALPGAGAVLPGAGAVLPGAGAVLPMAGAALALAADGPGPAPATSGGVESFWAAGQPPPLPGQPDLPPDLLLRLLPVPGSALGGQRLIAYLQPLYHRLP